MTSGGTDDLARGDWRIISHGEEAERVDQGRAATDLSSLASAAALFLRVVAGGEMPESLPTLSEQTELFVREIKGIAAGLGKTGSELSYQQLVPVRTWNAAISSDQELSTLTTVLPPLVAATFAGKGEPSSQIEAAELLDRAAEELATRAEAFLASST